MVPDEPDPPSLANQLDLLQQYPTHILRHQLLFLRSVSIYIPLLWKSPQTGRLAASPKIGIDPWALIHPVLVRIVKHLVALSVVPPSASLLFNKMKVPLLGWDHT